MQLSGASIWTEGTVKCKGPKVETARYSSVNKWGKEETRMVTACQTTEGLAGHYNDLDFYLRVRSIKGF